MRVLALLLCFPFVFAQYVVKNLQGVLQGFSGNGTASSRHVNKTANMNFIKGWRRFMPSCTRRDRSPPAAMGERRVSGWFVLSAVFIVLVFGMFFTFTERKTWPEHRVELTPMDMRLVPPLSTLWCEAVALYSEHPFVAYQVSHSTRINSKRLSLQTVQLQTKLGGSWTTNSMKLKYFLLPYSVIEIETCSSTEGVKLLMLKGDLDVEGCLRSIAYQENSASSEMDSDEDSIEDPDFDFIHSSLSLADLVGSSDACSSLIKYHSVDVNYIGDYSMECEPNTQLNLVKVNVTSADYYVIVLWNTNRQSTNVNLRILLDRTRYMVHRSGQAFDMCSLSTSCTIGLGFASSDRVLVTMPDEPNAGKSNFVIRSRCKPRLAVFAVLSVLFPLVLFIAVAFVVRADRDVFGKLLCFRKDRRRRRINTMSQRVASPLLETGGVASPDPHQARDETATAVADELPPPYHTLVDAPPPYACVKDDRKEQTN